MIYQKSATGSFKDYYDLPHDIGQGLISEKRAAGRMDRHGILFLLKLDWRSHED